MRSRQADLNLHQIHPKRGELLCFVGILSVILLMWYWRQRLKWWLYKERRKSFLIPEKGFSESHRDSERGSILIQAFQLQKYERLKLYHLIIQQWFCKGCALSSPAYWTLIREHFCYYICARSIIFKVLATFPTVLFNCRNITVGRFQWPRREILLLFVFQLIRHS